MARPRKSIVTVTTVQMATLLAAALDAAGLTQAELARQAGVSLKHVNQVLGGNASAQQGQLDYWAWLLGMHFEVTLKENP